MKKYLLISSFVLIALATASCQPSTPIPPPTADGGAQQAPADGTETFLANTSNGASATPTTGRAAAATATLWPTLTPTRTRAVSPTPPETASSPTLTATPRPSRTPTRPAPTAILEMVYQDDFQEDRGWALFESEEFLMEYSVGRYRMFVDIVTADSPVFSIRQQEYRQAVLEVTVQRYEGPSNGYYGLLCRFIDTDNYYRFTFDGEGTFAIGLKDRGEYKELDSVSSPEALKDEGRNRLRAECLDDRLALFLNEEKLLEVEDSTIQRGFVGLLAGTPDRSGLDVYFDNFWIMRP